MIEVYHGGTEAINRPLASAGREGMLIGSTLLPTAEQAKCLGKNMIV